MLSALSWLKTLALVPGRAVSVMTLGATTSSADQVAIVCVLCFAEMDIVRLCRLSSVVVSERRTRTNSLGLIDRLFLLYKGSCILRYCPNLN